MIKFFKDDEFKSIRIDEGGKFSDLNFDNCIFKNCHVHNSKLDDDSILFPRFENILINNGVFLNSVMGPSFLKNITIENLKTGDIFLVFSAMFHHVTLKGKIGSIKINKTDYIREHKEYTDHLDIVRHGFYSEIDWALDISRAKFLSFSCEGIPAKLIKRDSETQFVVTRKHFCSMDALPSEFQERHKYISLLLKLFLESNEDDQVLVTPLGKAKKYYMPILEGFQELRRIGILEPD
ncbi:hypothetical protein ACP7OL_004837 [Salmonella enterica subsp. enterica]